MSNPRALPLSTSDQTAGRSAVISTRSRTWFFLFKAGSYPGLTMLTTVELPSLCRYCEALGSPLMASLGCSLPY